MNKTEREYKEELIKELRRLAFIDLAVQVTTNLAAAPLDEFIRVSAQNAEGFDKFKLGVRFNKSGAAIFYESSDCTSYSYANLLFNWSIAVEGYNNEKRFRVVEEPEVQEIIFTSEHREDCISQAVSCGDLDVKFSHRLKAQVNKKTGTVDLVSHSATSVCTYMFHWNENIKRYKYEGYLET